MNSSGGAYDGIDYKNIRFKASGTGAAQTWAGDEKVYLSATEGVCYGYYPYSSTVTDITEIPVSTAGQVDYMYANPEPGDIASRNATLDMNHALSAIRFALKLGTYTGTGAVTAVSVTGSNVGTSATLNAMNGELSTVTRTGTAINVSKSLTLSNEAKNVDVIVIPTKTEAALTLSVTIDGKVYSTTTTAVTLQQGKCHTYTVTINASELSLSSVKVGNWGYDNSGSPTITAGGYTVTFAGDYSGLSFENSVTDGSVQIRAMNIDTWPVKEVSITGTANLSQSTSGVVRTIVISDIASDITVKFNGYITPPPAIAEGWAELSDGVYGVRPDFKPANIVDGYEGNEFCIGVGFVYSTSEPFKSIFMIEKYEKENPIYKMVSIDRSSNAGFYWGKYGTDQIYIDNFTTSTAAEDYDGILWSKSLVDVLSCGDSYTSYSTIGAVLKAFCEARHLGRDNWFIPSAAQFKAIYQKRSLINNALNSINGTSLSGRYWTSTEVDNNSSIYFLIATSVLGASPRSNSKYGYDKGLRLCLPLLEIPSYTSTITYTRDGGYGTITITQNGNTIYSDLEPGTITIDHKYGDFFEIWFSEQRSRNSVKIDDKAAAYMSNLRGRFYATKQHEIAVYCGGNSSGGSEN